MSEINVGYVCVCVCVCVSIRDRPCKNFFSRLHVVDHDAEFGW